MFGLAALLALLAAVIYIAGAAMAGFTVVPLICGVLWLVFAVGLNARKRWLGYFAFLLALAGAIAVYATSLSSVLPAWAITALIVLNVMLILLLFIIIWRAPVKASATS